MFDEALAGLIDFSRNRPLEKKLMAGIVNIFK